MSKAEFVTLISLKVPSGSGGLLYPPDGLLLGLHLPLQGGLHGVHGAVEVLLGAVELLILLLQPALHLLAGLHCGSDGGFFFPKQHPPSLISQICHPILGALTGRTTHYRYTFLIRRTPNKQLLQQSLDEKILQISPFFPLPVFLNQQ